MARISLILLLSMFIGKGANASFAIPDHIFGIKRILEDFRKPIQDKLTQLRQNYIERTYKNGIRFISNEKVVCPFGIGIEPLTNIVTYSYTSQVSTDELTGKVTSYENRKLRGCAKKDTISEKIKIIGKRAFLNDHKTIMNGGLSFQMNNGEKDLIDYRMMDSDGKQVVRIYSKVTGNDRITNFYMGDEKFMQIFYKRIGDKLEVRYKFYSFNFQLNRNGYEFRSHINARSDGYFKAVIHDSGAIEYYNDKLVQISFASFQKSFGLNGISFIMESILIELPKTDFVNSGGGSARLKEELRNAQTWLIGGNPAQLNLVRNLIEEFIQAADKNLLIDKRGKKQ